MSCQLSVFGHFQEVSSLREYLFPCSKDESSQKSDRGGNDAWTEDWSWNEDEPMEQDDSDSSQSTEENKHNWLQDCLISISPANDLMAVAYGDKLVLFSQKWDPGDTESETKFSMKYKESLKQDEGETITAVLCLPLASQKRSTQGAPDWTCIIVGFSTGYIRIYTETGTLLLSQLLHTEPVQKIKCRTYEPPRYLGLSEQHEELIILFRKALVTVDGFSLYQSLRACRNQVARATAGDTSIQPPPLAYKKWGLQGQERIQDCCTCGIDTPNPFDQMKSAAMMAPNATLRPAPSTSAKYITSGVSHYVGVYNAVEGSTQPILSEVAFAVASKLKSALMSAASGWLGFGQKQKEEDRSKPKIEPVTPLNMSFGLPDRLRNGDSIHLSPNNNYAATTDNFGRVILIDIDRGTAIRMWKGYRDAQLGWVQVKEDLQHGETPQQRRVAQFLIIYAPRRGILEVWTAGNGPRIAAFNVSKSCQLICPGYGYLGLNNVTSRGIKTRSFQCALIDPAGTIKTLDVPFHLALSDKNSKRARDLHLLKQLKLVLKDNTVESETLESTLKSLILDMKISSIAQQGVERVLSTKYLSVSVMRKILQACLQQFTDKDCLDIDSKMFVRYSELKDGLLQTYQMLVKSHQAIVDQENNQSSEEILEKSLDLPGSEATHIVSQLDQYFSTKDDGNGEKSVKRVKFKDDKEGMTPAGFLSCFQCQPHLFEQDASQHGTYELMSNLSDDKRTDLVKFLFELSLRDNKSANELGIILQDSSLSPKLLMHMLIYYWLSYVEPLVICIPALYHIIKVITELTDKAEVLVECDSISPWWQKIRDTCCHSNNAVAAYLLGLACRSVAKQMEYNQVKAKDPDADTASNEDQSQCNSVDLQRWDQLVKQLEDVLSLCNLLGLQRADDMSQPIPVSVSKLMEGGRGSLSELVAKYIAKTGLQPCDIVKFGLSDTIEVDPGKEVTETVTTLDKIQGCLELLQQRFVHSLDNDVLYANTSWENAVYWYNEPELVQNLKLSSEYLKLVQNAVLQHGVGAMMWSMFISKRFQSAALLMEKVGKIPKDRLTRKEIGISEGKMVDFMEAVTEFLDILMEANCEANEVPVFNIEPLWQDIRGPTSLVELAVEQKTTNYGLIHHHYHLSVIMLAVLTFNIKSVKVISLFDTKGRNSFFKAFDQHPLLPSQNVDPTITNNRKQFLSKIITCSVHSGEREEIEKSQQFQGSESVRFKPVRNWCKLVLELAKDFGLDLDFFKRHHVVELYSCGHDKLAEEVLGTVNDRESMGAELLPVAGCRVAYQVLVKDKSWGAGLLTNVSPTLSSWLRELKTDHLVQPEVDVQDISNLLQHVANCLPEGFNDYELAISLVDLVQSMKG
ncbi:rab3 GTPase-activating protein non-catalytic subunit-like [Mytilus trossulus]|uniref:rab3 GTPase-activating protein non-catalytic subunit-like n=1 Tax=Mytilus trossulus TaxID=6551 RepID=UPI003006411C